MFDISLRWQDGAIQIVIYAGVVLVILWIMSKIELKGGGESPIERERERE